MICVELELVLFIISWLPLIDGQGESMLHFNNGPTVAMKPISRPLLIHTNFSSFHLFSILIAGIGYLLSMSLFALMVG